MRHIGYDYVVYSFKFHDLDSFIDLFIENSEEKDRKCKNSEISINTKDEFMAYNIVNLSAVKVYKSMNKLIFIFKLKSSNGRDFEFEWETRFKPFWVTPDEETKKKLSKYLPKNKHQEIKEPVENDFDCYSKYIESLIDFRKKFGDPLSIGSYVLINEKLYGICIDSWSLMKNKI